MYKRSGIILGIVLILMAALILPSCTPKQEYTYSAANPIVLKFNYTMAAKSSLSAGWEWWGEQVTAKTGGKIKVQMYPSETLFKLAATMDSVTAGIADIANTSIGAFSDRFRLANITTLAGIGFPDTLKGLDAANVTFMKLYKDMPSLQAEFSGYKLLWYHQLANYMIVSKNKQISVPDDVKGLKVGGSGQKMRLIEACGGVPVSVEPPASYENLDKGVTQAYMLTWSQIGIYKIQEICKYYFDFGCGGAALPVIMNINSWNKISPADQKIMMDLWPEAAKKANENMFVGVDKGKKDVAAKQGVVVVPNAQQVTLWQKVGQPTWDTYINDIKAKGVKDADKFINTWKAASAEAWKSP